jgi:DNA-binding NarL/FixJ family response regulator
MNQGLDSKPDLDLGEPTADEADSTNNVKRLLDAGPQVVIFTSEDRPILIRRAFKAGARGLVLKSDPESTLIDTLRAVQQGEVAASSKMAHALLTDPHLAAHLAPRELEVFELLPGRGA